MPLEEIVVDRAKPALTFPSDLMTRGSGFLQFTCQNENGEGEKRTVQLPLPPSLSFQDGMSYDNAELSTVGAMAVDGKGFSDLSEGAKKYFAQFDGLTLEAAKKVGGDLAAKMGVKSAQLTQKRVPNPNTRALFKNPTLRNFQFAFELVATEASDKISIEEIIHFFRVNMYPADEVAEVPLMYKMPNLFTIEAFLLSPKGEEKPLDKFKIKPCYLTSAGTTLNGSSILAVSGSNPWFAKTDLSLAFMEERTLTTADIREGL